MYLVDTNVLMDYPEILNDDSFEIYVPLVVIKELRNLKNCGIVRKEKLARNALQALFRQNLNFPKHGLEFLKKITNQDIDIEIIQIAEKYNCGIISNDIDIKLLAKSKNIEVISYKGYNNEESSIIKLKIGEDDEDIAKIYSATYDKADFENQFIRIEDEKQHIVTIVRRKYGRWQQCNRGKVINSTAIPNIKAKNLEQECLMELLFDREIKIVYAGGSWGKGKSFLLTSYAIQELQAGNINKIVWVTNNAQVDNSREIGSLPGDLFEKELPFLGTFTDIVGDQLVEQLFMQRQIEILPIAFARGRSLENSIIIVNERENLTPSHIKLLVSRVGEGSRIFFDGDYRQTDLKQAKTKSGLKLLMKLQESEEFSKIFGQVTLVKSERSFTARAADYLDNIESQV